MEWRAGTLCADAIEVAEMAEQRNWYLICYDIREPKRWRRCFKLLKGYGTSLQYSIFRCRLTKRELERLRWELETELAAEDSLMLIGLCPGCAGHIIARNTKEEWAEEQPRFHVL
jgi:CRISPR-associated protein Cas2